MVTNLHDPVFGDLTYSYGWHRPYGLFFLGKEWQIDLLIAVSDSVAIQQSQRDTFLEFIANESDVIKKVEHALGIYMSKLKQRYPDAEGGGHALVPQQIIIQDEAFPEGNVMGMLFDCEWDVDNGVAVKIRHNNVEDVGPQDIVI